MRHLILLLILCLGGGFGSGLQAQTQAPERDFQTYIPRAEPVRIEASEAPTIDGDLSDPVWEKATRLTEFYQVEPSVGAPPVETEVFLTYDENALYIGVRAHEPDMAQIFATILERDGDVWRDDMVRFYIDPFDTGISGFGFDVNALGARLDRIIQPGRRPIDEWNTIWDAASKMYEDRWTSEIALPFRSISFDPEAEGWGLLITRERSHKAQEMRWAGIDQSLSTFNFIRAGRLEGIENVNRGRGLELTLQGATQFQRDWARPRDDDLSVDPSLNLLYKFTPSLSGLLTLNSDFSDTPLDNRQINTGRFSLFFPETRDFFLQDAAFFEFGGQAFNQSPNGQPFFSRRIGIVNGQSVTLDGGVKLSGELGGVEFGVLTARMGEADNIAAQTLSVARATYDVTDTTRIGFIATDGDPTGLSDNALIGVDALYQLPRFFSGGRLQADVYYQTTDSSLVGQDDAFGARLRYPNDRWNWDLAFRQVGADFTPALGFVNRPSSRDFSASWHRRFRFKNPHIAWWQFGTEHSYITDLDDRLETRETVLKASIQNPATDVVEAAVFENYENITTPFSLPTGIVVPIGTYQNDGVSFTATTSFFRPYGGKIEIEQRDFYGGEATFLEVEALLRPTRYFDIRASYERSDLSVPAGDVVVEIGSLDAVVNFSPKISVSSQTQYDNITESLSFFGRMQWEVRPQTEVFLSLGHGAIIPDGDFGRNFQSVQSQAILRIGNTFRF